MNELHLFAGSGGGILGGLLLGHKPICAVEWDKDARDKLIQRQKDGCLPRFPIWDDVSTFDGKPWKGITDIVCGGFPCQDISPAGQRKGLAGERSGLWSEMARIIKAFTPAHRILEEFQKTRNECQNKTEDSLPSYLCRVDDGLAGNVERLARIGNGQIPSVAALAFKTLSGK